MKRLYWLPATAAAALFACGGGDGGGTRGARFLIGAG